MSCYMGYNYNKIIFLILMVNYLKSLIQRESCILERKSLFTANKNVQKNNWSAEQINMLYFLPPSFEHL